MLEDYSPASGTVQNTAIWLCTLHLPGKENRRGQEADRDPRAIPAVGWKAH